MDEYQSFTIKEQRFIDEFMIDFNGTRAARDAGYSKNCAAEIAYENLRKPHIKTEIDRRLKEKELSAEQTAKMIADIARGNVNNYMRITKVEHVPRVVKPLSVLIKEIEDTIDFEEEYASRAGLDEDELGAHQENVNHLEKRKLRYEIELERNPKATRVVDGEPYFIETAELDLAALARDKENGKIKSFSITKDGPKVELYPADAALRDIARMHGMFKDKIDFTMNGNIDPEKWLEANNTGEVA